MIDPSVSLHYYLDLPALHPLRIISNCGARKEERHVNTYSTKLIVGAPFHSVVPRPAQRHTGPGYVSLNPLLLVPVRQFHNLSRKHGTRKVYGIAMVH